MRTKRQIVVTLGFDVQSLPRKGGTMTSMGGQASCFSALCRDKLKILNPSEPQAEFQPRQTDSATFEWQEKGPGAMSDPGKCRAITAALDLGKPVT